jgi:hypothetical protein
VLLTQMGKVLEGTAKLAMQLLGTVAAQIQTAASRWPIKSEGGHHHLAARTHGTRHLGNVGLSVELRRGAAPHARRKTL